MYDLLIADGCVIDPANNVHGRFDVAVTEGRVSKVAPALDRGKAHQVILAEGKWVLPGLVDMHVHIAGRPQGHRMLARAGVTTALDTAGLPDAMIAGLREAGTGLTVGFVYPLAPGRTVSRKMPRRITIPRSMTAWRRSSLLAK